MFPVTETHTPIGLEEALVRTDLRHAAHCLIHCTDKKAVSEEAGGGTEQQFFALMQVRSDGLIGFPGGHVDEGEEISRSGIVQALNRELVEEMNLPIEYHVPLTDSDPDFAQHHICSHLNVPDDLVCHFFHREVRASDMEEIENLTTSARDFPSESLGVFRIPVYWRVGRDGKRDYTRSGNDKFWSNITKYPFCGNAYDQLMTGLTHLNVIDQDFERLFVNRMTK